MTFVDRVQNEYFEWMYDLVCGKRFSQEVSYRKLLMLLHDTEFIFSISKDENRAKDGIDLRYRFLLYGDREDVLDCLYGPCSVLEMMVALSIHIEENIMDDPSVGDRTGQWFWGMIVSLGLGSMTDIRFDKQYATDIIARFLNRDYEPNGKGGLFTLRNCDKDLRDVEIWYQMHWYLDEILGL